MSALKVAPEITSTGRSHQSMVFFFTFTVQKTRRATRKDSSGGRQVQGTCFYGKRYSSTFVCTAFFRSKPYPEQVLFIAGPKGALPPGRQTVVDRRSRGLAKRFAGRTTVTFRKHRDSRYRSLANTNITKGFTAPQMPKFSTN